MQGGNVQGATRDRHIEVHALAPAERRMLLEMLAGERAGEEALYVGEQFGRHGTARGLCELRMVVWVARDHVAFTAFGRHVAESLANRLIRAPDPRAC